MFKNKIYGVGFSSPPKHYEVLKLVTKFLKEKKSTQNIQELEAKHKNIIENDLLEWNFIDANQFRQMYKDVQLQNEQNLAELKHFDEQGLSVKQWFEIGVFIIILGLIGYGIFSYFNGKEERDLRKQAENEYYSVVAKSEVAVKSLLKDPDSAEFKDQNYNCGYVNSKNSFGGYVGFKRYVVVFDKAVIEDANSTSESMSKLWDSACRK